MHTKPRPSPTSSPKKAELSEQLSSGVGNAARAARLRANLTQKAVAVGVHLSSEVYGRMERGGVLPSLPTFWRLCTFLQLSADAVLGLTQAPAPQEGESQAPARASPLLSLLLETARPLDAQRLQLLIQLATLLQQPADRQP